MGICDWRSDVCSSDLVQDDAAVEGRPHVEAACRRHRAVDPQQRDGAEALLAVGRVAEAGALLAKPEAARVVPGDYKRRDYLRMELARQSGDPRAVLEIADAALDDWPPDRKSTRLNSSH